MATVIGEVSAILAVAQIGINASKTIFEFVGEVKDAPKEIRRIGRDICTTSERLEEIGRLIENNQTSRLFNQGGIASAIRCSNDCREIIAQVNGLLAKGGWVADSETLEKKDFDVSLLDALRWPFVRARLASPQADLEKVKASLSLLFNSVMATASSNPMQSEYALQIPKLKKWAEQAARKAENEKRRTRQGTESSGKYVQREVHWQDQQTGETEEDDEMRQKFVEYQVKLVKEEEERKIRQRAALIQAENEAKRKAEAEARQAIEQHAIDQYKKEQDDIRLHKSEKEQRFKEELVQLGLESDKIQSIIDTTGFQELELESAKQNLSRSRIWQASKSEQDVVNGSNETASVKPAANGDAISSRLWLPRRSSKSRLPGFPPADGSFGNTHGFEDNQGFHSTQPIQLWLVDLVSGQSVELAPSRDWLRSKAYKARDDEIAHRLAKLKHPWRTAILDFLRSRNDREPSHLTWKLCFIGLPRRVSRLALFGHRRGDCLVRLVLCQHKTFTNESKDSLSQPNSTLENLEDSAPPSIKSQIKTPSNAHRTLRGALRHPGEIQDKLNGFPKKEPRGVSFADKRDSDIELDDFGTIRVDMEFISDEIQRGTTTMGNSLFPIEALEELGLPWRKLEEEEDGDVKELIQIPQPLSDEQIEQLKRITVRKILEGEIPWRKPPKWKMQETIFNYADKKPPTSATTGRSGKFSTTTDLDRESRKELPKPEPIVTNPSKIGDTSERLAKDVTPFRDYPDRDPSLLVPAGLNQPSTAELPPPRGFSMGRTDGGSILRRPDSWDIVNDIPREKDRLPQDNRIVQEIITHHRHIDHGFEPERFEYRRERDNYDYERERPIYREERDGDLRAVQRFDDRSRRSDGRYDIGSTYGPERPIDRDDIVIIRERERERSRPREEDYTRDRGRPRSVERERFVEREEYFDRRPRRREDDIVIREVDRSRPGTIYVRSPSPVSQRFTDERNRQIVIREREPPRPRDDRFEVIDRDSPSAWPVPREDRERRFVIRDRERERRRDEDDSIERITKRTYPFREIEIDRTEPLRRRTLVPDEEGPIRPERRGSAYTDDIDIFTGRDRHQVVRRYREPEREPQEYRPVPRRNTLYTMSGRDSPDEDYLNQKRPFNTAPTSEDIISTTLGEFTTFNADPEDDVVRSPTNGVVFPFPLSNGASPYATDLKSAQRKLDELHQKLEKANKDGDFLAASDLQFYAIPDVKTMVEELKASGAQTDPPEQGPEVKDSAEPSVRITGEVFKRDNPDEDKLQPRVVEISDGDDSEDLATGAVNGSARRPRSFGEKDSNTESTGNSTKSAVKNHDNNDYYDD